MFDFNKQHFIKHSEDKQNTKKSGTLNMYEKNKEEGI